MKNPVEQFRSDDIFFPLILTPFGKIPLIAATMTDEREQELAKKYPVKAESEVVK